MPSACQKTRSAPQKQPMPTTSCSMPSGNGGCSGVPSTSCRSGTCIACSRPGSASSGVICSAFFVKRNMLPSLRGGLILTELLGDRALDLPLGPLEQLVLLPLRPDEEGDEDRGACDAERDVDRRAQLLQCAAEHVVGDPEGRGPDDRAGGVEHEEPAPCHLVRASQERRVGTEDRDEAAPEDDLAAVAAEEPDPDLEPPFVEPDLVAVPKQKPGAAVASDREADVVPDDRACDRNRDHSPDL